MMRRGVSKLVSCLQTAGGRWQSQDKWPSYPGVEELSEDDPEVNKHAKVGGVLTEADSPLGTALRSLLDGS